MITLNKTKIVFLTIGLILSLHDGFASKSVPDSEKIENISNNNTNNKTDEKPFKCDHPNCNFGTNWKKSLTRHKKTHSDEKPFKCKHPGCNFCTKWECSLIQHKKTHSNEKPFKCDCHGCDYRAKTKYLITQHKKTHSDEKPFKCKHPGCNFCTKWECSLIQHKKTHSDEKFFKCDHPNCNFETNWKKSLREHKKTHSENKPSISSTSTTSQPESSQRSTNITLNQQIDTAQTNPQPLQQKIYMPVTINNIVQTQQLMDQAPTQQLLPTQPQLTAQEYYILSLLLANMPQQELTPSLPSTQEPVQEAEQPQLTEEDLRILIANNENNRSLDNAHDEIQDHILSLDYNEVLDAYQTEQQQPVQQDAYPLSQDQEFFLKFMQEYETQTGNQ